MELTCYIVDDERHCINLITDLIIRTDSFKIIGTATAPRKAIAEIVQLKPNVIFTDINMPYISGIELAKQVDHIGLVVFVSSDILHSYPQIDLKKSIFLGKPVSLYQFTLAAEQIRSLIAQHR